MTKRISATLIASLLLCLALTITASDATVGRTLQSKLNGVADTTSVGTVIIAFNKSNGLSESNIQIFTDNHTLSGFTPLVTVGNLPDTDLNVGRGRVAIGQRGNPDH